MPYWRTKDLGFTGLAFPFHLDRSGRVAVATTNVRAQRSDSLRQALIQLIYTPRGTRFFNRAFGAAPLHLLFSPNRPETLELWYHDLGELLATWEPRISLTGMQVVDMFESTAVCRIGFQVRETVLHDHVEAEIRWE